MAVVTEDTSESEGVPGAIIAVISVLVLLVIIAGIWGAINLISNQFPNSSLGKKIGAWKAKRALNKEQKALAN